EAYPIHRTTGLLSLETRPSGFPISRCKLVCLLLLLGVWTCGQRTCVVHHVSACGAARDRLINVGARDASAGSRRSPYVSFLRIGGPPLNQSMPSRLVRTQARHPALGEIDDFFKICRAQSFPSKPLLDMIMLYDIFGCSSNKENVAMFKGRAELI